MDKLYKLRSLGYAEIGDDIWFPNWFFNALIKLNKSSGRIEYIEDFPNHKINESKLYATTCFVNGQLVMVPYYSGEIVSYDIKTKKFISVAMEKKKIGEIIPYFKFAYVNKQYVYMFPVKAKCIIRYDAVKHTVKYLENTLCKYTFNLKKTSACFWAEGEIINKKIYIPFADLNAIAIFNIENEDLEIKYLDIVGGCTTINIIGSCAYLASSTMRKIYCWDMKKDNMEVFDDLPSQIVLNKRLFCGALEIENNLVFFPFFNNITMAFDLKSKKAIMLKKECAAKDEPRMTYIIKNKDNKNYVLTTDNINICLADYKDDTLKLTPYFEQDILYNRKIINNFLLKKQYYALVWEGGKTLNQYLDILIYSDNIDLSKQKSVCGKEIYYGVLDSL